MKKMPIIIITKDNPEYLFLTLKSLKASKLYNNPIIIIDDSSMMRKTQKFYSTNEKFQVSYEDWTAEAKNLQEEMDKFYGKEFIYIPRIKEITGIHKEVQIISTPKYMGHTKILQYAINFAFTYFPSSNGCCILDDDILFNPYWLNKTLELYDDEKFYKKIGILSVYSEKELLPDYDNYNEIIHNSFRGKMMFIHKNLYKEMKSSGILNKIFPKDIKNYMYLQKIADSLGYLTLTTNKSYIQSLEKRNLCGDDKILRYENNFMKPIAWN